jgi:Protein of unknown function (DUF1579)
MMTALRMAAVVVVVAAAPPLCAAQAQPVYGCDSPEAKQLDFWLGDWDLSFTGGTSRNRITKTLDGCVIVEQFTGAPGSKLDGTSVSTFDRAARKWKQTWVDNTGAYLDFTGGEDAGDRTFEREAEKDGRKVRQRMVFRDVKADSLKWLWQRSDDGGKRWTTTWEIDYKRVR